MRIRRCAHPWYRFEWLDLDFPCAECNRVLRPIFTFFFLNTIGIGFAILVAAAVSGCAPGFDGARQSLANAGTLIVGAAAAVQDGNEVAKAKILKDVEAFCSSRSDPAKCVMDEGERRFADLVAKRSLVVSGIRGAAVVVKAASDELPLVESGAKTAKTFWDWMSKLPSALAILSAAVADLMLIGHGGK